MLVSDKDIAWLREHKFTEEDIKRLIFLKHRIHTAKATDFYNPPRIPGTRELRCATVKEILSILPQASQVNES